MPTVEIKMGGLTASEVRMIACRLSRHKDEIPTYNGMGSLAPHWAPRVWCEGPELFSLITPVMPAELAYVVRQRQDEAFEERNEE